MRLYAFETVWSYPALHAFYRLSMHSATLVDRAVTRFVEHGEGHVEEVPPYLRLRAGLYDVVLIVTPSAHLVTVTYIHRAR